MATANTKSTLVTNADASPVTLTSSYLKDGGVIEQIGICEVAAADDDTSVYRFCRIPSGARMSYIRILNDAITAGTDYNLGLLDTAANGGAAVDDNLFGDAIDLSSARVAPLEALHEALDIVNAEKRVWELLGLSADPFLEYDLALTSVTVGSAAGTIVIKAGYVL